MIFKAYNTTGSQSEAYSVKLLNFICTGDALFFHSNVLHMSDPNHSADRRWAFIMAYNRASNNPVERLAAPFPRYIPLGKVILINNAISL